MHIPEPLENLLREKQLIICIGPGGVGKTTVTALLGIAASEVLKRKVLCATVDPSKRLAQNLGLMDKKGQMLNSGEIKNISEQLDALIMSGAWVIDETLKKYVPDKKRGVPSESEIYSFLRNTLRGLHELACLDILMDLKRKGQWQNMIIDTAPSSFGVDFLEMPDKIIKAINSTAFEIITRASISMEKRRTIAQKSSFLVLKTIEKLIGTTLLTEISSFLAHNKDGFMNLSTNAKKLKEILKNEDASIVQITTTEAPSIDTSLRLNKKIENSALSIDMIFVNRTIPSQLINECKNEEIEKTISKSELKEKLIKNFHIIESIHNEQTKQIERLKEATEANIPIITIETLSEDVCNLKTLRNLLKKMAVH